MEYEGAGAQPSTQERGSASEEPPVSLRAVCSVGMKCSLVFRGGIRTEKPTLASATAGPLVSQCLSFPSPMPTPGLGQTTLAAGPHEREPPSCGCRLVKDLPGHLHITLTPHQSPLPNLSPAEALLAPQLISPLLSFGSQPKLMGQSALETRDKERQGRGNSSDADLLPPSKGLQSAALNSSERAGKTCQCLRKPSKLWRRLQTHQAPLQPLHPSYTQSPRREMEMGSRFYPASPQVALQPDRLRKQPRSRKAPAQSMLFPAPHKDA